jgi:hypothetical protein
MVRQLKQAERGTKAHGDRRGWPDMPPEEIPTMSKYLREHNQEQILHRITNGSRKVIKSMRNAYGFLEYIEAYLVFLILAGLIYWRRAWQLFVADPVPFFFYLAYFGIYYLMYAWYVPIATGSRLVLAQVMPLLFVVSLGLHALLYDSKLKDSPLVDLSLDVANLVMLVFLVFEIHRVPSVSGSFTAGYKGCDAAAWSDWRSRLPARRVIKISILRIKNTARGQVHFHPGPGSVRDYRSRRREGCQPGLLISQLLSSLFGSSTPRQSRALPFSRQRRNRLSMGSARKSTPSISNHAIVS